MTQQAEAFERRDVDRDRDWRFVAALKRLVPHTEDGSEQRGDRAALASLRRALGREPGGSVEAYPAIYHALGDEQLSPRREQPYFVVAPLFALYPEGGWRSEETGRFEQRNLGASLALLALNAESGSIEKRFQALLDSYSDELPEHLRHAVSLLRAHDMPISWEELLDDVRGWDDAGRRVQRKWARAYWGHLARVERTDAADETAVGNADQIEKDEE